MKPYALFFGLTSEEMHFFNVSITFCVKVKKTISLLMKYGIPVLVGVVLIYVLYKNVDMHKTLGILRTRVNWWWFVPVFVVSILSHVFRALRWRLQLRAIGVRPSVSALVNSIFGTYAVNLAIPRFGEVWRSGYIAKRQQASFTTVLGSMVADRLSDTLTVLVLTIAAFFVAEQQLAQSVDGLHNKFVAIATSPVVWAAAVVCIAAVAWLIKGKSQNALVLKVRQMALNLWNGFAGVTKMDGKWTFVLYTLLIWGCYYMQLYIASQAFDYTCDLGMKAVLVLFVLSSIGMAVPTNGGLGAWHAAVILGMSFYGFGPFSASDPNIEAYTFAMVVWGMQTLLLIVLGIYAFVSIAVDSRRIAAGKTKVDLSGDGMQI